jgi:hypothetical protein
LIWKIPVLIADRKQPTAFNDLLFKLLLDAAVELKSVLAEVTTIIVFSLHGLNEISKPQQTVGLLLVPDMYAKFVHKSCAIAETFNNNNLGHFIHNTVTIKSSQQK